MRPKSIRSLRSETSSSRQRRGWPSSPLRDRQWWADRRQSPSARMAMIMGERVPSAAFQCMDEGPVVSSCLIDARIGAAHRPARLKQSLLAQRKAINPACRERERCPGFCSTCICPVLERFQKTGGDRMLLEVRDWSGSSRRLIAIGLDA